jgi:hypothetical protein
MFCENCFKTIVSNINNKVICPICKKDININNLLNLKKKDDIKKISFVFNDTEKELKKVMQNLSFQKSATNKYINFLENKVNYLLKENSELKNLNNSLIENQNNNSLNDSNYGYNTTNSRSNNNNYNCNKFLDINQIKKIEPKSRKRSSNKRNQLTPITFRNEKINNLNVQTASEQTNEKINILNVNINASNNIGNNNNLNYLKTPYNNKNENYNNSVNNNIPIQKYNNNSFYQTNNNINKLHNNLYKSNNINSFYNI